MFLKLYSHEFSFAKFSLCEQKKTHVGVSRGERSLFCLLKTLSGSVVLD